MGVFMAVYFSSINPDNWRIFNKLRVKEEQEKFVPSNNTILARAFAYREYNSKVHAIYNDDKPIGILMQYDYIKRMSVCLSFNHFINFTLIIFFLYTSKNKF